MGAVSGLRRSLARILSRGVRYPRPPPNIGTLTQWKSLGLRNQWSGVRIPGAQPVLGAVTLKQFTIDESYITDVTVRTEHDFIVDRKNPTHEDLIKILKGWDKSISISSKDHDEFTKLREQLEREGFIKIERSWWNGDRVLKSFKLNEFTLRKGHKFLSAGAMRNSIACARKNNRKTISFL